MVRLLEKVHKGEWTNMMILKQWAQTELRSRKLGRELASLPYDLMVTDSEENPLAPPRTLIAPRKWKENTSQKYLTEIKERQEKIWNHLRVLFPDMTLSGYKRSLARVRYIRHYKSISMAG